MADLLSCTVDPGGTGDYTSHQAAETANYGNAGSSLVSTNKYVECSLICTNDTADSACTIAGITTDADHYIDISVPAAYHHKGKYGTGNIYRAAGAAVAGVLNVQIGNVFVHGPLIYIDPGGNNNTGFIGQVGGNMLFEDIIVRINGTTSQSYPRGAYFVSLSGTVTVRNVLVYDAITSGVNKGQGFRVSSNSSGTVNFQNCGVVDSDNGFEYDNSGTCNLKNCYVFNISGTEYNGTYSSATYCGHTDGDPGTNGVDFGSAVAGDLFRDPSSNNFKIKDTNSPLYGVAEDLSGTFTKDFEGQTRNQWSLGPDELELTLVSCTVDPDGTGDYTSLSAAATDNFGVTNVDLVTYDEYVECECISSGGTADTTAYANVTGLTVDAIHFVKLFGGEGYRWTGGDPTDGAHYRLVITTDTALLISVNYTVVDGLTCITVPTTGYPAGIYVNADFVTIKNCVAGAMGGTSSGSYGINWTSGTNRTVYIYNTITVFTGTGVNIGLRSTNGTGTCTIYAYDCTFISSNWDGAFLGNNVTLVAKGTFFFGGANKDISISVSATISTDCHTNALFHDEAPANGTNWLDYSSYVALTDMFVDPTNQDYRRYRDVAADDGIDLSGDTPAVTTDILGVARPATPHIGAVEPSEDAPATTDWTKEAFPAGEEDLDASRWALAGMRANQWQPTPGFPIGGF